jgi:fatty acid desaturase
MNQAYEPLEMVRQTFKVDWYRCPIAKEQLRELVQRSDPRGAMQALGFLALLALTGLASWLLFVNSLWAGFAIALFCFGTINSFNPGLVTHELSHGTVFKTRWPNSLFLRFYSLLGWVNFHHYKRSHTFHHL